MNGVLQLWDVASHQPIGSPWPTPGDNILALAFSADGKTLHAAERHVPIQRYDLSPDATAASLCRRIGDGLSAADWKKYFPNDLYQRSCSPPRE